MMDGLAGYLKTLHAALGSPGGTRIIRQGPVQVAHGLQGSQMRRSRNDAGNLVPAAGQDYLFAPEFQAIQHGFEVLGKLSGSYYNHSFSDNLILLDITSTCKAGIRG
jgi:hypothetical protein